MNFGLSIEPQGQGDKDPKSPFLEGIVGSESSSDNLVKIQTQEDEKKEETDAYIDRCTSENCEPVYEFIVTLSNKSDICELSQRKHPLNDADIKAISQILKSNTTVTSLDVSGNNITQAGFHHLAECVSQNRTLVSINLGSNQAMNDGCHALLTALALNEHSRIASLDMQNNYIGHEGVIALNDLLKGDTVHTLRLQNNRICDEGILQLDNSAHALSPRVLHLGSNEISDVGATVIAQILRYEHTKIQDLDLSSNKISAKGGIALADSLKVNQVLTKLNLRSNQIRDEGAKVFMDMLTSPEESKCVLKELYLGFNSITLGTAFRFAEMLTLNKTLKLFDMQGIVLDQSNTSLLVESLQRNSTLKQLILDINGTEGDANKVFESAKEHTSIHDIVTDGDGAGRILLNRTPRNDSELNQESTPGKETEDLETDPHSESNTVMKRSSMFDRIVKELAEEKAKNTKLERELMDNGKSQPVPEEEETQLVRIIADKDKKLRELTDKLNEELQRSITPMKRVPEMEHGLKILHGKLEKLEKWHFEGRREDADNAIAKENVPQLSKNVETSLEKLNNRFQAEEEKIKSLEESQRALQTSQDSEMQGFEEKIRHLIDQRLRAHTNDMRELIRKEIEQMYTDLKEWVTSYVEREGVVAVNRSNQSTNSVENIRSGSAALEQTKAEFDLKLSDTCRALEDKLVEHIGQVDFTHSKTVSAMKEYYNDKLQAQTQVIRKMTEEQLWIEEEGIRLRVEQENAVQDQVESIKRKVQQDLSQSSEYVDKKLQAAMREFRITRDSMEESNERNGTMSRLQLIEKSITELSDRMSQVEHSMSPNDLSGLSSYTRHADHNRSQRPMREEEYHDVVKKISRDLSMSSIHSWGASDFFPQDSSLHRSSLEVQKASSHKYSTSPNRIGSIDKRMRRLSGRVSLLEEEYFHKDDSLVALEDM